ncbi:acyl-coenzyme A thioesterase PaaI-like protein [Nocardioides sp. BE266]|uniref:DUF5667 domain-containing protein n=1 Tax=Nocardioides sp. BE266 TaxID=2817725 RepID=UPI002862E919|nr:DUF5667 domain-containing protein [Nocardioides sp. BE266]MDR7254910.1 acyl-coenzyme A thioesterase PaaI-like protein [Nocardioides sp. BE266]
MTPAFSARRADEFEDLLSRGPDAPLSERDAARFAALLEVVADLRAVPEVAPRPEFVSSLRESLMAEADTVLVRQPPTPSRLAMPVTSRKRDRRLAVLLGGAAMVGAAATMAVAAQTALPGESLYGVKRGLESAEVRFAGDDAARGRVLLAQAGTRLSELEQIAGGDAPEQAIPDTLETFTRQSGDGVRSLLASYDATGQTADAQAARDFTAASMDRLEELQTQLPESARDDLLAAGRTLTDLDIEASNACATCDGGITTTPEFLLSSAQTNDLLSGLDSDALTLEAAAAPISGQDLTGITVPEVLQSPTAQPTSSLPTQTPSVVPDPTKVKPEPDKVKDTVDNTVDTVTDTTSNVATQLDGVTGGALGGLTSTVDDATGGLITEVTGTLDGLTGNTVTNATGGLLP